MLKPSFATWGSDPEGFFSRGGEIIGSEKVIPSQGLSEAYGTVIRDGVQFELNPRAGTHADLEKHIRLLLRDVRAAATRVGAELCFDGLVSVSAKELKSLTPKSRILGCMPSLNYYGIRPIGVDPVKYRKRSAGGHIHVGLQKGKLFENSYRLVPVFDTLVGLFAVLLDRDPGARERRENYGRAGEYRKPSYGIEYRTPSNFWLRSPETMRLVYSQASLAVTIGQYAANGDKAAWNALQDITDLQKVQKVIDTNSFLRARREIKKLVPFFKQFVGPEFIINGDTIETFLNKNQSTFNPFTMQNVEESWR